MQLQDDLWIEGAYYIDFDHLGQLRIVGPNNHLHLGSVGLYRDLLQIDSVKPVMQQVILAGKLRTKQLFWHDPAMGHIQRVRHLIERPGKATPSFEDVMQHHPGELSPSYISVETTEEGSQVTYRRLYHHHWYGVKIHFPKEVKVSRQEHRHGFSLHSETNEIPFTMTTDTDHLRPAEIKTVIKDTMPNTAPFKQSQKAIDKLLDRTGIEITHLVKHDKTSGFDYGTVFPRDWMEAADLGQIDLTAEAIHYIYHKAYEHVNPQGMGWHEDIVGEFQYEKNLQAEELSDSLEDLVDRSSRAGESLNTLISRLKEMYVIRNMVDIEPRYILGLKAVPPESLISIDIERIRRVARFIVVQAEINELVTFKKIPNLIRRHKHEEYYSAGNWRDSVQAFKMIHPVIAPYDVNAVFYPEALRVIRRHAALLQVDREQVEQLIQKWDRVSEWFKFTNADGTPAYALALYDVKQREGELSYKKYEVNHTDEAYNLFYAQPTEAEIDSFCKRLLDKKYFYTESGPTVVGAGDGYDTRQYHGRVIWTKQTAFAVAGLHRQLQKADQQDWSPSTKKLLREASEATAKASIKAWLELGAVPELHYDLGGQPHFYNDQPDAEGPMNTVQLWSAVGARRIIRNYLEVLHEREPSTRTR